MSFIIHFAVVVIFFIIQPRETESRYVGCYKDDGQRMFPHEQPNNGKNTNKACILLCRKKGFTYAGTQYGVQCFCGKFTELKLERKVADSDCNSACPGGGTGKCGGGWRNTVYETRRSPKHPLGCFPENPDQKTFNAVKGSSKQMTIEVCIAMCRGSQVAALTNGDSCACGKRSQAVAILKTKKPRAECDLACSGKPSKMCGAAFRSSVYWISKKKFEVCKVVHLEVLDKAMQAEPQAETLIGTTTMYTCSEGVPEQMTFSHTKTLTEKTSVSTSHKESQKWSTTVSVSTSISVEAGLPFAKVKTNVSAGFKHTSGGTRTFESKDTKTNSEATSNGQAGTMAFEGPGAALGYGYVTEYRLPKRPAKARATEKCTTGRTKHHITTIKLKTSIYGNAHFGNYEFKMSKDNCQRFRPKIEKCLRKLNNVMTGTQKELKGNFDKCFKSVKKETKKVCKYFDDLVGAPKSGVTDSQQCAVLCGQLKACKVWRHIGEVGVCFMGTENALKTAKEIDTEPTCTSGTSLNLGPCKGFQALGLPQGHIKNHQTCNENCEKDPKCEIWRYVGRTHSCVLGGKAALKSSYPMTWEKTCVTGYKTVAELEEAPA